MFGGDDLYCSMADRQKQQTITAGVFLLLYVVFLSSCLLLQKEISFLLSGKLEVESRLSLTRQTVESLQEERDRAVHTALQQNAILQEIRTKLDILITLKDAGMSISTLEDLTRLLDQTDKIPYGSPFSSGHRYTSPYGPRDETTYGGRPDGRHNGVDLVPKDPDDIVVRATADGSVLDFGITETMGKYIIYQTEGGFRLLYAHLDTIFYQDPATETVTNIPVTKGDRLGIMGNTGTWSTGPHLHLEMQIYDKVSQSYILLNPWRIIEFIGE